VQLFDSPEIRTQASVVRGQWHCWSHGKPKTVHNSQISVTNVYNAVLISAMIIHRMISWTVNHHQHSVSTPSSFTKHVHAFVDGTEGLKT